MQKNTKMPRNVKNFYKDQSGVAAIEFILTFPLLILVLFGCIELFGHFNAVRKVGNITASLADIVAQSRTITKVQLNALDPLTQSLMQPLSGNNISYTIATVRQAAANKKPKLVWEHKKSASGGTSVKLGSNNGGNNKCKEYKGANGKKFPPNQDVIYVTVNYVYDSLFKEYIGGPTTYKEEMIAVPRASSTVRLVKQNGDKISKCT